jgi:hypothetical protein
MRSKVLLAVAAVCAGLSLSYRWMQAKTGWTVVSSAPAPEGRLTAYHLRSRDTGVGAVSYGDHVVLSDGLSPLAKFSAPAAFAGHCALVSYRWSGPRELDIECPFEGSKAGPHLVSREVAGVRVRYAVRPWGPRART